MAGDTVHLLSPEHQVPAQTSEAHNFAALSFCSPEHDIFGVQRNDNKRANGEGARASRGSWGEGKKHRGGGGGGCQMKRLRPPAFFWGDLASSSTTPLPFLCPARRKEGSARF